MIRILHIYKDYFPVLGGIENHVRFLCTELAKDKNFQVQVLVTNEEFKTVIEKDDNFEVIRTSRICKFASTPISLSLFKWIARLETDIVHLHFPFPPGEIACLLFGRCKRMVLTYHSDIIRQKILGMLYTPFLHKILKKANAIIATSPAYVESSKYLSRYANECTIMPQFVDIQQFQKENEEKMKEIKERYGPLLVLFVGKFRYYKGIQYLIEAARMVDSNFLLIGGGYLEKSLKGLVRTKGLENKVYFANNINDVDLPSYYSASDVFVLPSIHRSEAFGIVLLEAMACGIPVISTELGTGTSWVNLHNQTGLVVPPRDVKALSDSINYLLANKEKRLLFGKTGAERVKREFSKEVVVGKIKELYYELLKEK